LPTIIPMRRKQPRLFETPLLFEITFKLSSSDLERIALGDLTQAAKEHIDAIAKDFPTARRQRVLFALLKFVKKSFAGRQNDNCERI
jgi:hypothetical protein